MKKLFVIFLALFVVSTTAHADGYYRQGYGGNWVAPFVGGAVVGSMLGYAARTYPYAYTPPYAYTAPGYTYVPAPVVISPPTYYYAPTCYDQFDGYDAWYRPIYSRICR